MKAFVAALTVGALALLAGASAASSARPSLEHYMIGFGHSPNAADAALVKSHGGTVRQSFASIGVLAVDLPSDQVNDVKQGAGVSYVEADPVRQPLSLSNDLLTSEYPATATNGLYGLVTTHTVEAQQAGYNGTDVKACVADTGLDTGHPDLKTNFVAGYNVFDPGKSVDVFALGVQATETHATHVSGIVLGAVNGIGIHGVAPEAKLYEARVLGTQPDGVTVEGETSQVMAGAQWLADQGCKVINMSLGGADRSQSEEALYNQIRKQGTLIVVSSGNDATNHPSFPGRYQSVLTVGAVDKNNKLASFSNTGAQLDLVAPGVDNLSSFPRDQGRDAFVSAGGKDISARPLEFAGATSMTGVTGALVNCGLAGKASDCGATPPTGFVALIQRGTFSFEQKVQSAMAAGAGAAIIYNNAANGPGNFNGTLTHPTNGGKAWIPAVSLSQTDGEALAAAPPATATVFNIPMAWNFLSGTSMAAPHVSGVAALVFGKNPGLTPDQVETILERTATDLGVPNYDTTYGWGLVNAQAAVAATP